MKKQKNEITVTVADVDRMVNEILRRKTVIAEKEIESKNRVDISLKEYEDTKKYIRDLEERVRQLDTILFKFTKNLDEPLFNQILNSKENGVVKVYDNPSSLRKDICILFSICGLDYDK